MVVDDRRRADAPVPVPPGVRVVRPARPGRGPAAARNAGWRACRADWIAFLDDDVEPEPGWLEALAADLAAAGPDVGGVQGRVVVPLPPDRRPTDWERNARGLERARWATADLAYRREALEAAGGFDERFPRAYREDADLGLRITAAGRRIVTGERVVRHPVRPAPAWVSVAKQAGNADDVLMRALHGRAWRARGGCAGGSPSAASRGRGRRRAVRGSRSPHAVRASALSPAPRGSPGPPSSPGPESPPARARRARWRRCCGRARRSRSRRRAGGWPATRPSGAACASRAARRRRRRRPPRRAAPSSPGCRRAAPCRRPCCSTATGRSSSTCPTTAIPRASRRCRAPRPRWPACGRPACPRRSSRTRAESRADC